MEQGHFLSSDGKTQVAYYFYDCKDVPPRAILQISHGMQEHLTRYAPLAEYLSSYGIVVCGNDHLGHGNTSTSKQTDGFFANKHGDEYVLQDLHKMTYVAKAKYPNLPFFLMGHSMGSFFARRYASCYPNELSGLILCGTSGKVKGTNAGMFLLRMLKFFKGKKAHSKLAEKLMNNNYFKYVPVKKTEFDWITTNPVQLEKYLNDERCDVRFTVSAYYDMIKTLKKVNTNAWAKTINKDTPIMLISGAQDPVGQYGKGVCQVYSMLEKQKVKHLDLRLYADGRHEPFTEVDSIKNQFYNDVLNFLERALDKKL